MATIIEVSVSTAPIERSSPSVMMTSVIGNDSSNNKVDWTSTFEILVRDRKPGASDGKGHDQQSEHDRHTRKPQQRIGGNRGSNLSHDASPTARCFLP